MAEAKRAAKRFAPLDPTIANSAGAPQLKGIVFDVDGTLWCVSHSIIHMNFVVVSSQKNCCCFFGIPYLIYSAEEFQYLKLQLP